MTAERRVAGRAVPVIRCSGLAVVSSAWLAGGERVWRYECGVSSSALVRAWYSHSS
jgi:hypothetical protein